MLATMRFSWLCIAIFLFGNIGTGHAQNGETLIVLTGSSRSGDDAVAKGLNEVSLKEGDAFLDLRIPTQKASMASQKLARALDRYQDFDYVAALKYLNSALEEVKRTGGADMSRAELVDLFIYRSMVRHAQGNNAAAWDDYIRAATIDPNRHMDAARFSPSIVTTFERARLLVAKDIGTSLVVEAPNHCELLVDALPMAIASPRMFRKGRHFLALHCVGYQDYVQELALQKSDQLLTIHPSVPRNYSKQELLILAKQRGFLYLLWTDIRDSGNIPATILFTLIKIDGQIVSQESFAAVTGQDLKNAAMGTSKRQLLKLNRMHSMPLVVTPKQHWYRKPWLWATVGVALTSAAFLPFVLAEDKKSGFEVRLGGEGR